MCICRKDRYEEGAAYLEHRGAESCSDEFSGFKTDVQLEAAALGCLFLQ